MIALYKEYSVICDRCGLDGCHSISSPELGLDETWWDRIVPSSDIGIRDMRKIAKEHGWIYSKGKDLCPKCVEAIMLGKRK